MADERDPPIVEPGFLGGVTVVDIGDIRVARGLSRRHHSSCPHRRMFYDQEERRIWCGDCEKDVEPFDAFLLITEGYDSALKHIVARERAVSAAEDYKIQRIATKNLDEAWRSRTMVPACPQCGQGLFPEDFKNGISVSLGRNYAEAQRRRKGKPITPPSGEIGRE